MTRDPNFEEQYFGIAVRKGNTKLLAQINDGLRKVYKNGTYAKVYHKWQHAGPEAPDQVIRRAFRPGSRGTSAGAGAFHYPET